jgi:predicted nucleic acid-binding protein
MPTSADRTPDALVDTSVAVALSVAGHEAHSSSMHACEGMVLGLAGHAWFETFSVLTRLPGTARRGAGEVQRLLEHNFPRSRFLDARTQQSLGRRLVDAGIAGGAVHDALVGAVAAHHGLPLLSRDRRAVETYRKLDVEVRLLT